MLSFLKLLPILQILLEVFKPGDGEKVTRQTKITALLISALLIYSAFVTYNYIEQYRLLVEQQSSGSYLTRSYTELKEENSHISDEARYLYRELSQCLRGSNPNSSYENGKQLLPPPPTLAPEMPVRNDSPVEKKREAAARPVGVKSSNDFRQDIINRLNEENSE